MWLLALPVLQDSQVTCVLHLCPVSWFTTFAWGKSDSVPPPFHSDERSPHWPVLKFQMQPCCLCYRTVGASQTVCIDTLRCPPPPPPPPPPSPDFCAWSSLASPKLLTKPCCLSVLQDSDGKWVHDVVIRQSTVKMLGWVLPLLPPLITDILISLDDKYLYFSNW